MSTPIYKNLKTQIQTHVYQLFKTFKQSNKT